MDPLTDEKHTAMFRYNLLQKIATLLRLVEALVLTALAFWSSAHVPDLLRHVVPLLVGPRFLFLLANAIVLSLLLLNSQSRHVADATVSYDDISAAFASASPLPTPSPAAAREEEAEAVVFEDKRVVSVESRVTRSCGRSRSVRMGARPRRRSPELRRAETDVERAKVKEETVGDDEFRRRIEAFIEKHWKFQKEESMAIVEAN